MNPNAANPTSESRIALTEADARRTEDSWNRRIGGPGTLALIAVGLFLVLWGLGFAYKEYQLRHPSDEVRAAEARAVLGAMKDRARVVYQRTGKPPATFVELGMSEVELSGSYFDASHYRIINASPEQWTARCDGVYSLAPMELIVTANLETGKASFNR